ncbi:peptidoglycan -binding protein [Stagnihabitans tardus]|uniref:Peptidoglycan -binding protein n=1 Tax=Stagnihabitans tardus TaxID=2699202 RepID=A0AAE5BUU8_9RHOB|nr:peptidoglycan -binding protein [Stagnihabitans tardus]NBZ87154.1 peptidoglycan -binding protein [Stagnihabitans tardus]
MGLSRRRREEPNIWAGFVDAVTTLLMVMMFVLTILTVAQSVLRDTINTQSSELSELNAQVAQLAEALGLERTKAQDLQTQVGSLSASLTAAKAEGEKQSALIATLTSQLTAKEGELTAAQTRIASFEAQVASLLAEAQAQKGQIGALTASVAELEAAQQKALTEQEALNLALAKARTEIDAGAEAARLAAARREALEKLIEGLKAQASAKEADLTEATAALTEAEKQRLVDAAAAQALQDKLKGSEAELTAMTLALEEQRKKAEETLTLLAAAEAAKAEAEALARTNDKSAALAQAEKILSEKEEQIAEQARNVALLNQQMTALRAQLGELQGLLDASAAKDADNKVQIAALGSKLNQALAQVASEQKRRADLEAAEAERLRTENQDLAKYRSEFFGELSKLLADKQGVRVVGDRFVFSSEVLFQPGAADLSPEGQAQIAQVVQTLNQVVPEIPPTLNWIIRVDGHTDATPLSGSGEFKDNWQLSQARALAVVRYMTDTLGFPPGRLAAAGFGEFQPVAQGETPDALAQNRRIELKLTER